LSVNRQHSLLGVLIMKLAYMLNGVCSEVRLPLDQNVFCVVIVVEKCIMAAASPGNLLVFRTAWK